MSSTETKTINKVKHVKDKKAPDNKVIREEMLKEMKEKDLMIKDLKENLLRVKVEKNSMDLREMNIRQLDVIREETSMADKFIKTIIRTTLVNFDIAEKVSLEDRDIEKKTNRQKAVDKKEFITSSLEKMNFNNCNCSTCTMNKSFVMNMMGTSSKNISKEFNLTSKVAMGAHYDFNKISMKVLSYNVFLGLFFFSSDLNAMVDTLLVKDLNTVKQMICTMKKMFIDEFFFKRRIQTSSMTMEMVWTDFLKELPKMPIFQDPFFQRIFWAYKQRIMSAIVFHHSSSICQDDINEKMTIFSMKEDSPMFKERFFKFFFQNAELRLNKAIPDISRYQPSEMAKVLPGNKSIDTKVLDMEENNKLWASFLELERMMSRMHF